jgi:hypothetical protein
MKALEFSFWFVVSVVTFAASGMVGCSTPSDEVGRPMRIEVSGSTAKVFTLSYDFRGLKGSVSNAAFPEPKTVLEGPVAGDGTVEIKKADRAQGLTVDIYESGGHPVHLLIPPGSSTGKATRTGMSWQVEVF